MHRPVNTALNDAAESSDNNFHLIRILCAWGVLVAHSYVLSGSSMPIIDPAQAVFGISLGTFCVMVFFAISGFLIQRSLLRSSSLISYSKARALRLLPALLVVLVLTVFVLGPLATQLPLNEYFAHASTWHYLLNLNLLDVSTQFPLADVFASNPFPNSVNGSIWTLPFETWMYVMTVVFWLLKKQALRIAPKAKPILGIAILILVSMAICVIGAHFLSKQQQLRFDILLFISTFFIGANLYNYRAKIQLSWLLMLLLLIATPWLKDSVIAPVYLPFTIAYSTLVLAYRPAGKIRHYNRLGDYSYGLYIYAFPVQQSLAYWVGVDFICMVFWSSVLTLPLAMLSWHFIEAPALKLKSKRRLVLKTNG